MAEPREEDAPAGVPVAGPAGAPTAKVRVCKCGHARGHHMVSPSGEYTFMGWCLIMIGISAEPRAIAFSCRECGQTIERTTDPKVIAETNLFG